MGTENTRPPDRITATGGFYIIVAINSCFYYRHRLSKGKPAALAFGEADNVLCFLSESLPSACEIIHSFCSHPIPQSQKGQVGDRVLRFICRPKL